MMDPRLAEILKGPNFAHVATSMKDGSPHSAPLWIDVEEGHPIFYKEASSVAVRNLRRDPRLAISILAVDNPYVGGYLRGRVIEFRGEPMAGQWLDAHSVDYTSKHYPSEKFPGPGVLVVVEVERSHLHQVLHMTHAPRRR